MKGRQATNKILYKFRYLYLALGFFTFFDAVFTYARAPEEKGRVANVGHASVGGKIVIHYDLIGPGDKIFKVGLTLAKKEDVKFSYRPVTVTGSIGDTVAAGNDKQIVWDIGREYPQGLEGGQYFFGVEAETAGSGTSTWLIVGGAVVIGGVAALLLFSKKPAGPLPVFYELPDPGGRPNR